MVHFTSPDFLFNIRHLLQSWSLLIIYVVPVRNYKDCLLIALISTDYVRGYYHAAAFAASRLLIIFPLNKLVFEQKFEPSFEHPTLQGRGQSLNLVLQIFDHLRGRPYHISEQHLVLEY